MPDEVYDSTVQICKHCKGSGRVTRKSRTAKEGMERVASNTSEEDKSAILRAIRTFALEFPGREFQTAEVWPYIPEEVQLRVTRAVMGPMVKEAEKIGWVKSTGVLKPCEVEGFHSRGTVVWISNFVPGHSTDVLGQSADIPGTSEDYVKGEWD